MIGTQFGSLSLIKIHGPRGGIFECRCSCGAICFYPRSKVLRGYYVSCGCRKQAQQTKLGASKLRHGHAKSGSHSRTYRIWQAMLNRCRNKNQKQWANYGGRGISVCSRWGVFENFLADMGLAPLGLTLDRVDNDGPYSPDNCRWASSIEQRRNSRSVVRITVGGISHYSWEWAEQLGISVNTVYGRFRKYSLGKISEQQFLKRRIRN